uniref:Uncharacterized protein n=1 Tax=Cajanus cajan TaxID=3821 RepID=A0A151R7B0_CAJCA|nr:hypothetical protein KK1_040235 [Cajanus cajan]
MLKFFAWQLAHGIIPTQQLLWARHVGPNTVCFNCYSSREDLYHLLFECNSAMAVWARMGIMVSMTRATLAKEWQCGFYGDAGITDNLHAELRAIQKGLMIAWQRNFRNVICVSDSLHAINLVLGSREPFHRYAMLVAEIKDLLGREWRTSLVHSLRKGNQCADFLSKWGPNCKNELVIIDDIPVGLQPLLQADSSGVLFRRV